MKNVIASLNSFFVGEKKATKPVITKIHPNPSRGPLTIEVEGNVTQLKILSAKDQVLGSFAISDGEMHLNLSSSPRGAYYLVAYYGILESDAVQFILE